VFVWEGMGWDGMGDDIQLTRGTGHDASSSDEGGDG